MYKELAYHQFRMKKSLKVIIIEGYGAISLQLTITRYVLCGLTTVAQPPFMQQPTKSMCAPHRHEKGPLIPLWRALA